MWTNTDEPGRNDISYEDALVFQGIVDVPGQYKPPIYPRTTYIKGNTNTYQSISTLHKPEIDGPSATVSAALLQQGIQKPVKRIVTSDIRMLNTEVIEEMEMPDEPVLIASEKSVPMPGPLDYHQFLTSPAPPYDVQKQKGFSFGYDVQRHV